MGVEAAEQYDPTQARLADGGYQPCADLVLEAVQIGRGDIEWDHHVSAVGAREGNVERRLVVKRNAQAAGDAAHLMPCPGQPDRNLGADFAGRADDHDRTVGLLVHHVLPSAQMIYFWNHLTQRMNDVNSKVILKWNHTDVDQGTIRLPDQPLARTRRRPLDAAHHPRPGLRREKAFSRVPAIRRRHLVAHARRAAADVG
ncbi:hypothetical protein MPL3365_70067 [Mesorhizobium plurifarium]|uniref:Uncharacterized protein n=1 Tax=Mesorhizobium plurifarium TaxID=69974 RepID=A0A090GGU1_MESPL|nr:hypothetical protein MPL3365_70067 [Mesorhizobium plurifarium]